MLFQQSGWLCLGVYRANRLDVHRFPLEGHAASHIQGNGFPPELHFALRRQSPPAANGFDTAHQWKFLQACLDCKSGCGSAGGCEEAGHFEFWMLGGRMIQTGDFM